MWALDNTLIILIYFDPPETLVNFEISNHIMIATSNIKLNSFPVRLDFIWRTVSVKIMSIFCSLWRNHEYYLAIPYNVWTGTWLVPMNVSKINRNMNQHLIVDMKTKFCIWHCMTLYQNTISIKYTHWKCALISNNSNRFSTK